MNSIFMLQDVIKTIIREEKDKKYFFLMNKWNTITFHDGRKFKVKIYQEEEI